MRNGILAMAAVLALGGAGCGKAGLGESCSTSGSTDECENALVCDSDAGKTVCLKQCTDQTQCSATEQCNGVSGGNLKACHPK